MRLFRLLLLGLLLPAVTVWSQDKGTLLMVSDPWPGYLLAPQGGYFLDLVRQIYEPAGYQIVFKTVPFKRGLKMLQNGEADMAPALYRAARPDIVLAAIPTAVDSAAIICRQDFPWNHGASSLQGKHLAWTRGFAYDESLAQQFGVKADFIEVDGRQDGLAMLQRGWIDGYIDNTAELISAARQQNMQAPAYQTHVLFSKGLYFGFPDTPRGRQLLAIFDHAILQMQQSGKLNQLYSHDVPDGVPLSEIKDSPLPAGVP